MQNKSKEVDPGSSQVETLGKIDGLSTIMGKSHRDNKPPPKLFDEEEDHLVAYNAIKELFIYPDGRR